MLSRLVPDIQKTAELVEEIEGHLYRYHVLDRPTISDADFDGAVLREAVVDGLGIKPRLAFGPLRVAVTGRRVSPPLFESMEILGKHSTMERLKALRATL